MPQVYDIHLSQQETIQFVVKYKSQQWKKHITDMNQYPWVSINDGYGLDYEFWERDENYSDTSILITVNVADLNSGGYLSDGDRINVRQDIDGDYYVLDGWRYEYEVTVPDVLRLTLNQDSVPGLDEDIYDFILSQRDIVVGLNGEPMPESAYQWTYSEGIPEITIDMRYFSRSGIEFSDGDIVGVWYVNHPVISDYCMIVDSEQKKEDLKDSYGFVRETKEKVSGDKAINGSTQWHDLILDKPCDISLYAKHNFSWDEDTDEGYTSYDVKDSLISDTEIEYGRAVNISQFEKFIILDSYGYELTHGYWFEPWNEPRYFDDDAIRIMYDGGQVKVETTDIVSPQSGTYRYGTINYGRNVRELVADHPYINKICTIQKQWRPIVPYIWNVTLTGLDPNTKYNVNTGTQISPIILSDDTGSASINLNTIHPEYVRILQVPVYTEISCNVIYGGSAPRYPELNGNWMVNGVDVSPLVSSENYFLYTVTDSVRIGFREI